MKRYLLPYDSNLSKKQNLAEGGIIVKVKEIRYIAYTLQELPITLEELGYTPKTINDARGRKTHN